MGLLLAIAVAPGLAQAGAFAPGSREQAQSQQEQGRQVHVQKKMKSGWLKTKAGWRFYHRGKAVTGLHRIKGVYHYFNAKGVLKREDVKCNGVTFYIEPNGVIIGARYKGAYYYSTLKRMTWGDAYNFRTYLGARKVIASVCNRNDSMSTKRLKLFRWVADQDYTHYYWYKVGSDGSDWIAYHARKIFDGEGGDCHGMAAAYAYLLQALGYNPEVCIDGYGTVSHSWVECDGRRFDPVFAKWQNWWDYYDVTERGYYDENGGWVPLNVLDSFSVPWFWPSNAANGAKVPAALLKAGQAGAARKKGALVYYEHGKQVKNCWRTINGKRYYFKSNGRAATLSIKVKGTYYVFDKRGALQSSSKSGLRTVKIAGETYRVNGKGEAVAGWSDRKNRFFTETGKMVRGGWKTIGRYRYYFSPKGTKMTGCVNVNGAYYLFNSAGQLQRGNKNNGWIVNVGSKTYRVALSGKVKPGWSKSKGRVQRFSERGLLLKGIWYLDGSFYAAKKDGTYLPKLTEQLNKAVRAKGRATDLRRLLGSPKSEVYAPSCDFAGDDGMWEYRHFYVLTARPRAVGNAYKTIDDAIAAEDAGKAGKEFERVSSIKAK